MLPEENLFHIFFINLQKHFQCMIKAVSSDFSTDLTLKTAMS